MKKVARSLTITMAFVIAFSMAVPVQAVSKKYVYVCTKITNKMDDEDWGEVTSTVKYSYKKNGLLKSANISVVDGLASGSYKYYYGSKSRIKKQKYKAYVFGTKNEEGTAKYSYNKKGYLTKIVTYNKRGKKTGSKRIVRSSKGLCKKATDYSAKGKVKETRKYAYDKKGRTTKIKTYKAGGKLSTTEIYVRSKNKVEIKEYNAKDKLIKTTVAIYKHGDVISSAEYDETKNHELTSYTKYSYKKVKTTKRSVVRKQQEDLAEFIQ